MSAEDSGSGTASFARQRRFWTITRWAAVFGVVMGGVGIVWLLVVEDLTEAMWGHPTEHDFAGGKWWWIPLATGFGLVVGLRCRWLTAAHQPDLFTEIGEAHVDRTVVPASVGVSAVSLMGGASLGPEGGLGLLGGGLGDWISKRTGADPETSRAHTLIAVVLAKVITFAASVATGFIGGTVFPMLFIGGTAGMALHATIPGIPAGLAVPAAMAAVPGAPVAIPFSLIAIVGFAVTLGAANVAPIGIAVLTSYLLVVGTGMAGKAHAQDDGGSPESDEAGRGRAHDTWATTRERREPHV